MFNYDQRGRLVSETRTAATAPSQPYVTQYTYDPANRLKTITYPSGRIVTMARDAAGRVITVVARPNAAGSDVTLASSITYTPFGAIAGLTFGNGVVLTRGFDTDGRLISQTAVTSTGGAIQNLGYRYDLAGRIAAISDSVGTGSTAGWTPGASSYVRTAANNQLASIAQGGSTVRQFTYDAAGNVLTDTRTGNAGTFTYNGAGQLVAYARNASTVAAYTFDGLGRRAEASVITGGATAITRTIYSGGTRLAINDASGWVDLIDLGDIPLAVFDHGTLSYVHADQLGTPLKATDSTGAVVKNLLLAPFGATVTSTGSTADPRRFPGQVLDAETGLHQNIARSYDPTVGRYVSPDPIGLNGGINLYQYVGGNPIRGRDPLGLVPGDRFATPAGAANDALSYINPVSIEQNVEYGGKIRADPTTGQYYADAPMPGDMKTTPVLNFDHTDATTVGDYHTHGDYSRYNENGDITRTSPYLDQFDSDRFSNYLPRPDAPSGGDIQQLGALAAFLRNPFYMGYLGTPSGKFLSYCPATGATDIIN